MDKTLRTMIIDVLVIIISIVIGVSILFPGKIYNVFKHGSYVVISGSMEPIIPVNSVIVVKSVDKSTLKVGDIITFSYDVDGKNGPDMVTHAIAQIEYKEGERVYNTKPEVSNEWDDWLISDSDIRGKVIKIVPKIGIVILFLNKFAYPILIGLNLLVVYQIYKYMNQRRSSRR
ncbi:MAG: signal peptidase I [Erysipelothrix sp.]|nr:signal peptidase I [Erysipelothrix sp.]